MSKSLNCLSGILAFAIAQTAFAGNTFNIQTSQCAEDVQVLTVLANVTQGTLVFNASCDAPAPVAGNGFSYANSLTGSFVATATEGSFSFKSDNCVEDVALLSLMSNVTDGTLIIQASCGAGGYGANGLYYDHTISGTYTIR